MNREEKKLRHFFEELGTHDTAKSRKKALQVRKAMTKKKGGRDKFDHRRWETAGEVSPSYQKRRRQITADALATPLPAAETDPVVEAALRDGTLISITRRIGSVLVGREIVECLLPSRMAATQQTDVAVGDRVRWWEKDDGSRWIHSILPRRTFLARPDPHYAHMQRVIAANIDVVVNVVSVKFPPLRPRLIDRYLIAIMQGGAQPLICVNKSDLLEGDELREELACLDAYSEFGVEAILCSTKSGAGIGDVIDRLRGRCSVFVGHSGVGKSTILQSIVTLEKDTGIDIAMIKTGAISEAHGTGTHTTRLAALYDLGGGTSIIDTPGIREFGLWALDVETLKSYFPEFDELAIDCKFRDCIHTHEPDCAVKDAVEAGEMSEARFDTYLRLMEELQEQEK
ncbi:MAG: ribosome small subunit-dependent GTPase A [Thermoanaerobaculia bacterium]